MTQEQKSKLVALAKGLVGKPYKYGAKPEEAPDFFDCSLYTQYLFRQIGMDIPRTSLLQAGDSQGKEIPNDPEFINLEIGDLLFMRSDRGYYTDELFGGRKLYIGHVAMYIGEGFVIHSRKKLNGVVIQNLKDLVVEPNYEIQIIKRF